MITNEHSKENIRRKRERAIILVIVVLVILVTFLLTYTSGFEGVSLIPQNILVFGLININVILLVLLIFLVVRNVVKLVFERRRGILGSKLRTKLVVAFVGLSLIPTLLLFWVAIGFITNTIENWFSLQVETSLEDSLKVAQIYYKTAAEYAIDYAKQLSEKIRDGRLLNQRNIKDLKQLITEKQIEYNLSMVEAFSSTTDEILKIKNTKINELNFARTEADIVQEALDGKEITRIQPVGEGDIIRGAVPIYSSEDTNTAIGVIVISYYIPKSLVSRMEKISSAFQEYKKLKLYKSPIKLIYLIMLSVVTLLIIFSATWFGFHLSRVISVPIGSLAAATKQIAHGNLDVIIEQTTDDEIGSLVNSFNKMTTDLKLSKEHIESVNTDLKDKNRELDQRRKYMEIVLNNVAAGVLSIDQNSTITTFNKSAEKMFNLPLQDAVGKPYSEALSYPPLNNLYNFIREINRTGLGSVFKQISLSFPDRTVYLLIRATMLRDEEGDYLGLVLVAEDVTQLQQAQRAYAWKEVARRIAHEVKNPLTPIKLSAQRLRKRFLSHLNSDEQMFDECTRTIINQVDELKTLVNEFSSFARLPATNQLPHDINEIIEETVLLYKEAHKRIELTFQKDNAIPLINIDRDQIKRAIINILDNAIHSIENDGRIYIKTVYNKTLEMVIIEITDTGCGIAPEIKHKLFEPYFSTKKTGTGLGLAIVNTIIADHNGYIRIRDNEPQGTRFIIELPARTDVKIRHFEPDNLADLHKA